MRPLRTSTLPARVRCHGVTLHGSLTLPADAAAVVLVVQPRPLNTVAATEKRALTRLHENGLATFHFELAGEHEPPLEARAQRDDLVSLARRVRLACDWLQQHLGQTRLPLGIVSSGLACAAAFTAAAEQPAEVNALVARSGRPDLAGAALRFVTAPTLFIVGSETESLLAAHQLAFEQLPGTKSVEIILGGGPELAEPDISALAAESTAGWLAEHLCAARVS